VKELGPWGPGVVEMFLCKHHHFTKDAKTPGIGNRSIRRDFDAITATGRSRPGVTHFPTPFATLSLFC